MPDQPNRREFLSSSALAAGWLALNTGALATLAACAREDAATGAAFTTLTPDEAVAMRAFAAQIMPSGDGLPGAEEAGAVHFIDRAVGEWFQPMHAAVTAATEALNGRAGDGAFADLDGEAQRAIMEEFQTEAWFGGLRFLSISGVLADAQYGGNRGGVGFQLVKMEHTPTYTPPFGYYDAQAGGVA